MLPLLFHNVGYIIIKVCPGRKMDKKLINIGIDINLKIYSNEVEYIFRNFMNICGYPSRLVFIDPDKKDF